MIVPSQITVFGGTGFVGRAAIAALTRQGAVVRIPTRDLDKGLPLKTAGAVGQIVPRPGNIRSDASVAQALAGADCAVNLIGIMNQTGENRFQTMHVEVAARIARIAKEQGVRHFVHISALGAHTASKSAYARSKIAGEEAVRAFFPEATILRPSLIFGAEDRFFNRFAAMARFMPALPLIGGGLTKFQPVYVGDVAESIAAALRLPTAQGQIYELGGPEVYTFRRLIEMMLQVTGRKRGFVSLPWSVAKLAATFLQYFPGAPLTRDQVELLKADSIVTSPRTLRDLGLTATPLDLVLPVMLSRYRPWGGGERVVA